MRDPARVSQERGPVEEIRRRTVGAARAVGAGAVRRAVNMGMGAPLSRYGGLTKSGAATLARALQLLIRPPDALRRIEHRAPLEELARRAGIDDDQAQAWADAGLLGEPATPGPPPLWEPAALGRLRLVAHLVRRGAGEADIRAAHAEQRLPLLLIDHALRRHGSHTLEEAAERAGLDIELATRLRQALGIPPQEQGTREYTRRDIEGMRLVGVLRSVISDAAILELAAVLGHAMSQYAGAEVELFRRELVGPIAGSGDELEAALSFASVVELVTAPSNIFMASVHRAHLDQAVRAESLELIEAASGTLPDTVDIAVGFADLVGFTAASERLSALEVGEMATGLHRRAEAVLPAYQGRIIKAIGDGIMFTLPDLAAVETVAAQLVAAAPAPMRLGIAYGPVLRRAGDCFGRTVNLASRLCAAAAPGRALVARGDGSSPDVAGRRRRISLRGFADAVAAVELSAGDDAGAR
jgi:adenylate cyclase